MLTDRGRKHTGRPGWNIIQHSHIWQRALHHRTSAQRLRLPDGRCPSQANILMPEGGGRDGPPLPPTIVSFHRPRGWGEIITWRHDAREPCNAVLFNPQFT